MQHTRTTPAKRLFRRAPVGAPAGGSIYRPDAATIVVEVAPGSAARQLSSAVHHVSQATRQGCRDLVIDLVHVERMSSDLLALLLWANTRLRARGARLVLARASDASRSMLERTGLDHVLVLTDDLPTRSAV